MRLAGKWIARAAFMVAVYLWVVGLAACSSASIPPTPSPEDPDVACIGTNSFGKMNPQTGGRVLPEAVHVIGITSPEDGERSKVVRGVFNQQACIEDIDGDECGWLPFDSSLIKRGAICGPEVQALASLRQPSN